MGHFIMKGTFFLQFDPDINLRLKRVQQLLNF